MREKRDGGEIWSRGSHRENQPLANYLMLQTSRYAKTSILQLREDALEILGRTKVGFAPYRPYPFFSKVSTVAFFRLGCWTAEIAASLDTNVSIPRFVKCVLRDRLTVMVQFEDCWWWKTAGFCFLVSVLVLSPLQSAGLHDLRRVLRHVELHDHLILKRFNNAQSQAMDQSIRVTGM